MVISKFWFTLFLASGLLGLLVGCVPPTPPPSPTPWPTATTASTPVKTTVTSQAQTVATRTSPATRGPTPTPSITTISVWENLSKEQAQALTEAAQAFQKESPYFRVTLHHYDTLKDLASSTTSEAEFDVALVSPALLSSLWMADQVAPMSDFFAPNFIDSFASITLEGASRDGKVWGLSDTAGFHLLLFYNRDLVDPPPTNTDEMAQFAERLIQRGQAQGKESFRALGVNSYDPLWLVPWLLPYHGWLTDKTGRPTLNTAATQEALKLYLGWQDAEKGIAPVATYDEMRSQFVAGNLAMIIDGDWAIRELSRATKIDWGVTHLPNLTIPNNDSVGDEGSQPAAPLVLARYWAINRSTSGNHALAATAFLEYITRPEWQLERATRFGLLPTRREALNDPLIVNDPILRVSVEQMLAGHAIPLGVNTDALLKAMRDPLRQAIDGKLTPEQAAEMMQTNAEK